MEIFIVVKNTVCPDDDSGDMETEIVSVHRRREDAEAAVVVLGGWIETRILKD